MDRITEFKNFTIVHQLRNRLRIIAPCLIKDNERAYILQILLLKREAINHIKVVSGIGSVTIDFDSQQLPGINLLNLLEAVLGNIGSKPQSSIKVMGRKKHDQAEPSKTMHFAIEGMSCSSCALYLEMVLKRDPEIVSAQVNFINETANVSGYIKKQDIFEIINTHGYRAYSLDTVTERKMLLEREQKHLLASKNRLLKTGLLGLPVFVLGFMARQSPRTQLIQAALSTAVIAYSARDIFRKALMLARQRNANMDSLIALGVGSAYSYSVLAVIKRNQHVYFESATGIIMFVLLGRYLEEIAKANVVRQVHDLVNLQPQEATLLKEGEEQKIAVDSISDGDILLIRPGAKIPADGVVLKGLSAVDESRVTGVSKPCIKETGHALFDGSINGSGVLQMRATATGNDTVLSGLIHLVEQAQSSGLPVQKTVDKIATLFVPAILLLSGVTFTGWRLAGQSFAHAFSNSISVLLIACPCSLGLATPAATMVGTGQAARRGVYVRNSEALESAAAINAIVFDKTGTLTEANGLVSDVFNVSALDDTRLIQLAASAEFNSEHFVGKAIVEYGRSVSVTRLETANFINVPDQGIRCSVANHDVLMGNEQWLREQNIDLTALKATAKKLAYDGNILVYMALDNEAVGLFSIAESLRVEAAAVIRQLHDMRIQTQLVSGDTHVAASQIAKQVGIKTFTAQAGPAHKMRIIQQLQEQGYKVAMIGDGINDAPALAVADVGLAIGSGSDITLQTADFLLLNGDMSKVADSILLSRDTLKIIKQNLFWAFSYNVLAIPVAAMGKLNPVVASAAMAFSSLSVIANSLRLSRKK